MAFVFCLVFNIQVDVGIDALRFILIYIAEHQCSVSGKAAG